MTGLFLVFVFILTIFFRLISLWPQKFMSDILRIPTHIWYNRKGLCWKREGGNRLLAKIDPTVKRMTVYIAVCTLVLSVLMEAVYLVIGAWVWTVLFGNLLGAAVAVLNFFLMGLTIQHSLSLSEEDAKKFIRVSQSLRMLMILVVCAIGAAVPAAFELLAVVLPQFFPRVGTMLWPKFEKNAQTNG